MPERISVAGLTFLLHYLTALAFPQLFSSMPAEQLVLPLAGITLGLFLLYGHIVVLAVAVACGLSLLTTTPAVLPPITSLAYSAFVITLCYITKLFLDGLVKHFGKKGLQPYWLVLLLFGVILGCLLGTVSSRVILMAQDDVIYDPVFSKFSLVFLRELLGVLYFTPLVLVFRPNPYLPTSKQAGRQLLIGTCIYIFLSLLFISAKDRYEQEARLAFTDYTNPFVQQVQVAQTSIRNHLDAMKGLFKASKHVSRDDFKTFTESLHSHNIKIRALGWIPRIKHTQRHPFVASVRDSGISEFIIKQVTPNGILPSSRQEFYYPILYLEPLEGNRPALGLDVATHPVVASTVERAIRQNIAAVSPLLTLAQQKDKATGLIVYHPVFIDGPMPLGLIEAVFEIDEMLISIQDLVGEQGYHVRITYGEGNQFSVGNPDDHADFYHQVTVPFFDQTAMLEFFSTSDFNYEGTLKTNWLAHIFGILCGLLINLFMYMTSLFNRQLATQVDQKTHALREANLKLKQANEAQSKFLANMSHEIRTPLNGIMGVFQILEKSQLPEATQKLIQSGKTSSATLLKILNDILDIAKIEAGKLELEIVTSDLHELVETTLAEFQPLAKSKSILLDLDIVPDEPKFWMMDPVRVKQILNNLISNAVKFTERGHVHIKINKLKQGIEIHVTDTGIGMNEDGLKRLFQRFEQADQSTTRRFGGTGLGMAITKQLIELMEGTIKVKSIADEGSQFCVYLPLTSCVSESPQNPSGEQPTPNLSSHTLLLAEDNLINQEIFLSLLEDTKANILVAQNGKEAVDLYKSHKPDLIFMDIQMPVMDGVDACKMIRKENRNVPIVSVSANTYEEDIRTYFASGFNAHIPKPVELPILYETLNRFLLKTI